MAISRGTQRLEALIGDANEPCIARELIQQIFFHNGIFIMTSSTSIEFNATSFGLRKNEYASGYIFNFSSGDDAHLHATINLDDAEFEELSHQVCAFLPSTILELASPEENKILRDSTWPLQRISDRTWQQLLRETQPETLLSVLWYLKDLPLAQAALRNMSVNAASQFIDDLSNKFEGINPDTLHKYDSRLIVARASIKEILSTLNRFIEEGFIGEDFA
jgi:hypothetical protein